MSFQNWMMKKETVGHRHKKHRHSYFCPGCGARVYVGYNEGGPIVLNHSDHDHDADDAPHHCPTTSSGTPSSDFTTGAAAATSAAASAAGTASGAMGGGMGGAGTGAAGV